jgi:hypothetical protein
MIGAQALFCGFPAVRVVEALLRYQQRGLAEHVSYGPMVVGWRITREWSEP